MGSTDPSIGLPDALAQHWDVSASKVQNVEGHAGAVTLLPGSLLVQGKVLLPAGTAVADLVRKSDKGKDVELRKKASLYAYHLKLILVALSSASQTAGAGDPSAAEEREIMLFAACEMCCIFCFEEHTEYFSEEQDMLLADEKVVADSAKACQKDCHTSEVCSVFTFFVKERSCLLIGGNFSAAANKEALSGPATCPPSAALAQRARGAWPADLPGQLVAGSESTLEAVEKVPVMYLALTGLLLLGIVAVCLMSRCGSKAKGKKAQKKWHNQALYLPISEEDEDAAAREVRSRDGTPAGGVSTPADSPRGDSKQAGPKDHGPKLAQVCMRQAKRLEELQELLEKAPRSVPGAASARKFRGVLIGWDVTHVLEQERKTHALVAKCEMQM
eukprot:Skav228115  [mRNA]  locus=scaffold1220:26169:42090:+ [translate_table: standard]